MTERAPGLFRHCRSHVTCLQKPPRAPESYWGVSSPLWALQSHSSLGPTQEPRPRDQLSLPPKPTHLHCQSAVAQGAREGTATSGVPGAPGLTPCPPCPSHAPLPAPADSRVPHMHSSEAAPLLRNPSATSPRRWLPRAGTEKTCASCPAWPAPSSTELAAPGGRGGRDTGLTCCHIRRFKHVCLRKGRWPRRTLTD